MKLAGKLVALTGGGQGIGRELTLQLLQRGASVAAMDRSKAGLDETASLVPSDKKDKLGTFVVDVTDRAAVMQQPEIIQKHFGRPVDGIINNAGIIQPFVHIKDLDFETIDKVMNVNWNGTMNITKAFLPTLLSRPEAHVCNISSMGGFMSFPGQAIYGAGKAAIKLMTEALFAELQGTNCRVTVVHPGAIATNISKNSGVSMPAGMDEEAAKSAARTTSPKDAAKTILDGMEKNEFRVLVGSDSKFLDKFYRFDPKRATVFITNQMAKMLPKT